MKVTVENGTLRISGERKAEKEEKTTKYYRIERSYGSFQRAFTLPDGADGTKVSADCKDGVLKVHLPQNRAGQAQDRRGESGVARRRERASKPARSRDCFGETMSINEILGTIHDGNIQVCATADADYDHTSEKISVALGAFARHASATGGGAHLPQPWLPPGERVNEHLSRSEADEFVKDVFHSWVAKVRASIPSELPLRP